LLPESRFCPIAGAKSTATIGTNLKILRNYFLKKQISQLLMGK
jgi:hypothetical protein